MTKKSIGLTCLGLFVGSIIGAIGGFGWAVKDGTDHAICLAALIGCFSGAVVFGILTPLTSGRVLKILNPAIIRGDRFEKSSVRKDWKWGVGGLGTLIGMVTFEAPIAFANNFDRGVSDTATVVYIFTGLIICVLFLFCFADIVPSAWAITMGILGWVTAFSAAGLMAFGINVSLGACHLGLGLFAAFSALGMIVGLFRGRQKLCEPTAAADS